MSSHEVLKNVVTFAGIILLTLRAASGNRSIVTRDVCTSLECEEKFVDYGYLVGSNENMCKEPYDTICNNDEQLHIRKWESNWNYYKEAELNFHKRAHEFLTKPNDEDSSKAIKRARIFHKSCLDVKSSTGNAELEHLTKTIRANPIGAWPLLGGTNKFSADNWWQKLDNYYLNAGGDSAFLEFSSTVSHDKRRNVIVLDTPKFLIPEQTLLSLGPGVHSHSGTDVRTRNDRSPVRSPNKKPNQEEEEVLERSVDRSAYHQYIYTTLSEIYKDRIGEDRDDYQRNEIENMISFEMRLANISQPEKDEKLKRDFYLSPTLEQWQGWYNYQSMYHDNSHKAAWEQSPLLHFARGLQAEHTPCKMNWEMYIYRLWKELAETKETYHNLTSATVKDVLVDVTQKIYFLKLCVVMRTTPPETIMNYLNWRYLRNGLIRTRSGHEKFLELAKRMNFAVRMKPRWLSCVEENALMGPVYGVMMANQFTRQTDVEEDIRKIYRDILNSLVDRFLIRKYYSKNSLKILDDHVNKITINIFGDSQLTTDKKWNSDDLPGVAGRSTYFDHYIEHQKWRLKAILVSIINGVRLKRWPILPDRAGVFVLNRKHAHQLYVPAAILQPPFYDQNKPELFNYAGLGAEIATTLWHSAVFPTTFSYESYKWVERCMPVQLQISASDMELGTISKIFINSKQGTDGAAIALDAYMKRNRYDDSRTMPFRIEPISTPEPRVFLAAYIASQCARVSDRDPHKDDWKYTIAHKTPVLDEIGLRDIGLEYPLREASLARYRIESLATAVFYMWEFDCGLPEPACF